MKMLRKLKQLYDWIPIIWKDEDWDYSFLLLIVDYKLSRMSPVIRKGACVSSKDWALEIEKARILIRNIKEDPDDEWTSHYQSHHYCAPIDGCIEIDKHETALKRSLARGRRNWHKLWRHFDKHMQDWWN